MKEIEDELLFTVLMSPLEARMALLAAASIIGLTVTLELPEQRLNFLDIKGMPPKDYLVATIEAESMLSMSRWRKLLNEMYKIPVTRIKRAKKKYFNTPSQSAII